MWLSQKNPTTLSVSSPVLAMPCGTIDGMTARSPARTLAALVAAVGLALARDDVEDLLGAVGVGGEVLAGLDLEVDDGRVLRAGEPVDGERGMDAPALVAGDPGLGELELRGGNGEHRELLLSSYITV